jgi:hypothetical protein
VVNLTNLGEDEDDLEEEGLHGVEPNEARQLLVTHDEEEEAKESDKGEHGKGLCQVHKLFLWVRDTSEDGVVSVEWAASWSKKCTGICPTPCRELRERKRDTTGYLHKCVYRYKDI